MSDALCGVEPLLRPPGEVLSSQRRYVIQSILVHTHITHPYRPEQADNRDLPVAAASAPADVSHHRRWVVVELSEPAEGLLHIGYRVDGLVNLIAICGTGEVDHLRDVIVRPYIVFDKHVLALEEGSHGRRPCLLAFGSGHWDEPSDLVMEHIYDSRAVRLLLNDFRRDGRVFF